MLGSRLNKRMTLRTDKGGRVDGWSVVVVVVVVVVADDAQDAIGRRKYVC